MKVDIYTCKLVRERSAEYDYTIDSIDSAGKLAMKLIGDACEERVLCIALNTKNKVVGVHIIGVGGADECIVDARSVFRACLLNNATRFIIAHNHPSGDTSPSPQDLKMTDKLAKCGLMLGIPLLDHIIVGLDEYTSLKRSGYCETGGTA